MTKRRLRLCFFELILCVLPTFLYLPISDVAKVFFAAVALVATAIFQVFGMVIEVGLWGWSMYYAVTEPSSWHLWLYIAAGIGTIIYMVFSIKEMRDISTGKKDGEECILKITGSQVRTLRYFAEDLHPKSATFQAFIDKLPEEHMDIRDMIYISMTYEEADTVLYTLLYIKSAMKHVDLDLCTVINELKAAAGGKFVILLRNYF